MTYQSIKIDTKVELSQQDVQDLINCYESQIEAEIIKCAALSEHINRSEWISVYDLSSWSMSGYYSKDYIESMMFSLKNRGVLQLKDKRNKKDISEFRLRKRLSI